VADVLAKLPVPEVAGRAGNGESAGLP